MPSLLELPREIRNMVYEGLLITNASSYVVSCDAWWPCYRGIIPESALMPKSWRPPTLTGGWYLLRYEVSVDLRLTCTQIEIEVQGLLVLKNGQQQFLLATRL